MAFDFATAGRIVFGAGTVKELAPAAASLGRRALLVRGRTARVDVADAVEFEVTGEPDLDIVRAGVAAARAGGCDLVVACGGGSVLDAGKAIAALLTNDGDLLEYLEVVGQGRPLPRPAAPCIAVPTTAGTGSEVTRNAVLASPAHRVKASLRSASMLPRLAIVDPQLTLELPRALTASTGLDALTQLIEPYVCIRANELTDLYCVQGIERVARSLRRAWIDGKDLAARTDMALASLFGGLSLANAGLGAVHGFAAPVGGMFDAPHGAVCAAVLPHATAVNVRALRSRAPGSAALQRYSHVARLLTGRTDATAEDCAPFLAELTASLEIPGLSAYGLRAEDADAVCEKAARASSMKANPIVLTREELGEILAGALRSD
jgi:alcohol dehydrogenase class IV